MRVIMSGEREEIEIANKLLRIYDKKAISIEDLMQSREMDSQGIRAAVRLLEKRGHVYVMRVPRVIEQSLRTDLQSSDIVYFNTFPSIQRKTLLYKTGVEYGDYTINHILGCAHGCEYPCYAMQISKRYGRVSDRDDWMHPRLVENALDLLEEEIPRLNSKIQFVHLSFMTDPFMYDAVNKRTFSWVQDLTLKIIRRLNQDNIKVTALTKGLFPEELNNASYSKENEYGITLVSFQPEFHARYEPFSPDAEDRLSGLKRLSDSGLKTWVSLEPYPTPNIVEQDLTDILERVKFVDKLIFGKWNYNPEVNGYEGSKKFYTKCSDQVIESCRQNGISLHIKEYTPRSNNKTQSLFYL